MYIHLHNGQISCLIPEEDANFPGVPIKKRYSPEFLKDCIVKDDSYIKEHNLHAGMAYDAETDTFVEPPKVEIPTPMVPEDDSYNLTEKEINAAYEEGVNNVE